MGGLDVDSTGFLRLEKNNYHKQLVYKNRNVFFHSSGGQKSKISRASPEAVGENTFVLLQSLVALNVP